MPDADEDPQNSFDSPRPCTHHTFPCLTQFKAIKDFLNGGGSAALLLGEGGEERLGTNVNYLLEEYGMTLHKDSVVRNASAVFCPHPLISRSNSCLHRLFGVTWLCESAFTDRNPSILSPGTLTRFSTNYGSANRKETAYGSHKASICLPRHNP